MSKQNKWLLCDLDGTISRAGERKIFFDTYPRNFPAAEAGVIHDEVIEPVRELLLAMVATGVEIVVLTARQDSCRSGCEQWLERVGVPFSEIMLKPKDDMRKDYVAKKDLVEVLLEKRGLPVFALEDRSDVADMLREQGIFVLTVKDLPKT